MIHYKISQDCVDGLHRTMCGEEVSCLPRGDDYQHIPRCDGGCVDAPVDCPKCIAAFNAVREYKEQ